MLHFLCIVAASVIAQPEPERELRNYAAELNAPILAIPVEERAWTVYRDALIQLQELPAHLEEAGWPAGSEDDHWAEAIKFIDANQAALAEFRRAASMKHLGYVLSDVRDPVYVRGLCERDGIEFVPDVASENPWLLYLAIPYVGPFGNVSHHLRVDARRDALEGDGQGVVENFAAMLGMAAHVRESNFLIAQTISWLITRMVIDEAKSILVAHPQSLSEKQWQAVAELLGALATDESLRLDTMGERLSADDMMQRCFTDDGNGSGRLSMEGYRFLMGMAPLSESVITGIILEGIHVKGLDIRGLRSALEAQARQTDRDGTYAEIPTSEAAAEGLGQIVASRLETRDDFLRILSAVDSQAATPLWERTSDQAEVVTKEVTKPASVKHVFAAIYLPKYSDFLLETEVIMQRRDATLVAIALELFRREQGAFPQSLNELVPAFLDKIPPDRFDGKPLRYKLTQSGPVLYSVGSDLDDDGGIWPDVGHPHHWFTPAEVEAARSGETDAPTIPEGDWILFSPGA